MTNEEATALLREAELRELMIDLSHVDASVSAHLKNKYVYPLREEASHLSP